MYRGNAYFFLTILAFVNGGVVVDSCMLFYGYLYGFGRVDQFGNLPANGVVFVARFIGHESDVG